MVLQSAKKVLLLISISLFSVTASQSVYALSAVLDNAVAIVTDADAGTIGVEHTVAFTLPEDANSVISTDYIHIDLTNFTSVTTATSVTGTYSGTASFSLSGTTARVTGITILPGDRVTVRGITATNPTPSTQANRTITITVTEDEAGTLVSNTGFAVAQEWTGQVTTSAEVDFPQGRLSISGFTAPNNLCSLQ